MISTVYAMGGSAPPAGQGSPFGFLPLLLIIFFIWYLLLMRPEKQKRKERQKMLEDMKKGDKVITAGGICGVVAMVKGDRVVLKVTDNVRMEFTKSSVSRVEES